MGCTAVVGRVRGNHRRRWGVVMVHVEILMRGGGRHWRAAAVMDRGGDGVMAAAVIR